MDPDAHEQGCPSVPELYSQNLSEVYELYIYKRRFFFFMRNWLMRLWRLRKLIICQVQAGDFRKASGINQDKFEDL